MVEGGASTSMTSDAVGGWRIGSDADESFTQPGSGRAPRRLAPPRAPSAAAARRPWVALVRGKGGRGKEAVGSWIREAKGHHEHLADGGSSSHLKPQYPTKGDTIQHTTAFP